MVGLDAGRENIIVADTYLKPELRNNVQFVCTSAEDYIKDHPDLQFDGVVASEVIEHVQDPKLFLQVASQLVKVNLQPFQNIHGIPIGLRIS